MTGHRRAWIVRKNRASRRLSVRLVRRRKTFRNVWLDKMTRYMQSVWESLPSDLWSIPDTTNMQDIKIQLEPYWLARTSNIEWVDRDELARRYEC